jgi:hypothetical protein
MGNNISSFFSKGNQSSKIEKFNDLSSGKNKKEIRELEKRLLKPDKIPKYVGIDGENNLVYKYNPMEYEERWKQEGIDLTK